MVKKAVFLSWSENLVTTPLVCQCRSKGSNGLPGSQAVSLFVPNYHLTFANQALID